MDKFREAFDICVEKAKLHKEKMKGELCEPVECNDGLYYDNKMGFPLAEMYNWMTSFVTGMGPIIYKVTNDKSWLEWTAGFFKAYEDKIMPEYTKTMHDIGFLYIPYAVDMYKATGDKKYRTIALKAADELVKRFDVYGRYIEAWSEMNTDDKEHRMIIDSMMNIPIILWAWKETGYTFYRDVALAHAETAKKILVRDDYSVAHAYFFDEKGNTTEEANNCGYSNGSHWARGTAWSVFGFAIVAEMTGKKEYLELSMKIADKYLECLGDDGLIPIWDFRLPKELPAAKCDANGDCEWDESKTENIILARDSSAAAIISCGFVLISKLSDDKKYMEIAKKTAEELIDSYFNTDPSVEGMLMRTNGKNKYSIYADYYFMLLLSYFIA